MHLCKSFRWGEERLHRSPKSLRWDEEPLYRSPRVRKFYTFLPAKHCKWGAASKSPIRSRALWRPVFGHAVRCIPLGANNQWGIRKTPLIEVSLYAKLLIMSICSHITDTCVGFSNSLNEICTSYASF